MLEDAVAVLPGASGEEEITEGLKDIYKTMYQEANVDLKASFNTINENLIEEVTRTNLGTKLNESRDIFALHNEILDKIVFFYVLISFQLKLIHSSY